VTFTKSYNSVRLPLETHQDMDMDSPLIIGSVAENPFVEDIAQHFGQVVDYSDLISLKSFLNREFCPRFIPNGDQLVKPGTRLTGKTVMAVSTSHISYSRDELAMRNCLLARAAKDNGAARFILLEPDLYYSAQDRGPRPEHGSLGSHRSLDDMKKFDGQPYSTRLYADILKSSGVDEVITIHNHSESVKALFLDRFDGAFHDLTPSDVYAGYIRESDIVNERNLVLCAPDSGAVKFTEEVSRELGMSTDGIIRMKKTRRNEREVSVEVSGESKVGLAGIKGKDVVVLDDMVRTGTTIVECCRHLRLGNPRRVVFFVTHFHSSREGRINMNDMVIDEIVTTSTIPQILNRDVQGRLRHKLIVLRIARWISNYVRLMLDPETLPLGEPLYSEDMSSKNPRWRGKLGPLFS
jgi:ribose-phosphate pyrophosphokinase